MSSTERRSSEGFKLPNYLTEERKEEILLAIKNNTPIIIGGKQGPTGKTTLANILRENGVLVYEEWECLIIKLD